MQNLHKDSETASHRLQIEIQDVDPAFNTSQSSDMTARIIEAIRSGRCTLLKNRANYRTDRPANAGKLGNTHVRGNSESEVSFPFNLGKICNEVGISSPTLCVNSLRMYGQISDENPLHFHGYDTVAPEKMEFIIFSIKMIAPYDPSTGAVFAGDCTRHSSQAPSSWDGKPPFLLIYEEGGLVRSLTADVGDVVILPSGVFHEFSCLPTAFVDVSSIEVASEVAILSGASWKRNERETAQKVISRTIYAETGYRPPAAAEPTLTLADIPSIAAYVETARPRLDATGCNGLR